MDVTQSKNEDLRFLLFSTGGRHEKFAYNHPPLSYDAFEYEMNNRDRGIALIFNHENFADIKKLKKREGTHKDCARFKRVLESHHFTVRIYHDKTRIEIFDIIDKVAASDHTHYDCLMIVIMSHGGDGVIYSSDDEYKLESIMEKFTVDRCKTLAGKPKLFFIQACRGGNRNQDLKTDASQCFNYKIPIYADFLVTYSTVPGYISWRDEIDGSWFIQTLCKELEENGKKHELVKVLTMVNRRIAHQLESLNAEQNEINQIPCITSMLTGGLRFK